MQLLANFKGKEKKKKPYTEWGEKKTHQKQSKKASNKLGKSIFI